MNIKALNQQRLVATLILLLYAWLYGPIWLDMERVWRSSATYNHCYLIIPISLYFFYYPKTATSRQVTSASREWLPLLILGLLQLFWVLAFATDIALLKHLVAVLTLQVVIWLLLGNQKSYHFRFAIGYLIFLVPFGDEFSFALQNITADLTVWFLHLANIPVYRDGLYLTTPVGLFEVAEACSGLRFLVASIAISVLFAYLHYNKTFKQVSFVIFMAVMSIFANGVRAFMLVYIGEKSNMRFGFGADHYLYGWLFFGLVLLAGFWLGARFADPQQKQEKTQLKLTVPNANSKLLGGCVLVFILVLGYRLQLNLASPPAIAATLNLKIDAATVPDSNWGVSYANSLAFTHLQGDDGVEYYVAYYANKQSAGKLISWDNKLYDPRLWQQTQSKWLPPGKLLQLKSLAGENRSVLYWYRVGDFSSHSTLRTKLYQALHFLIDNHSGAYVVAVSLPAPANQQTISLLENAAARINTELQQLDLVQYADE